MAVRDSCPKTRKHKAKNDNVFVSRIFVFTSLFASAVGSFADTNENKVYLNEFAVCLKPTANADEVAKSAGFTNKGTIIGDCYLFTHHEIQKRSFDYSHHHHSLLREHNEVLWVEQQHAKNRVKRSARNRRKHTNDLKDPLFKDQWYLNGGARGGYDMNVEGAWKLGYTGKGVVITILDDGVQKDHPDLALNYDSQASYDINDSDPDPYPRDNGDNKHGTRCAGEVSAIADNEFCGVGVAYNSSIGGVRMLDGTVTDEVEARALSLNPNHVDIYSASWGPEDDGKTVDGPGTLATRAFLDGIKRGRGGLGSVYVWASGNGGRRLDNCNCDGYTNSIYTLSISSATQQGTKPWYLEECSSTLATTYSSGSPSSDKNIVTVDMDTSYFTSLKSGGKPVTKNLCTDSHTGTSASAPIAAGIVALALEANPKLSWRDIQHIVVATSRYTPLKHEPGWTLNGVKRMVSHKFGYGLMDAEAMVRLAKKWKASPLQRKCETNAESGKEVIPGDNSKQLEVLIKTSGCRGTGSEIGYLEHVQARLTLSFAPRGKLKITLVSPSNTSSHLLFSRPQDTHDSDFNSWPFLSVHFWGENPSGTWKLILKNDDTSTPVNGFLVLWRLIFYGTHENPQNFENTTHYLPRRTFRTKIPLSLCGKQNKFKSSVSDECLDVCPDGQFGDYETGVCTDCSKECSTCYGPASDNCLSCKNNFFRDTCIDECPDGTFSNFRLRECLPCSSTCKTCVNNSTCSSCGDELILNNQSKCVQKCEESQSCSTCDETCSTCSEKNPKICTSCKENSRLHRGKCITTACPEGYYEQNNECIKCHYSCKTCDGASHMNCLSCHFDALLKDNGLCFSCPARQFMNIETKSCGLCHESCGSCSGPTSTDCTSCGAPLFLDGSRCVPCCSDIKPQMNDLDFGDIETTDCCRCQSKFGPCISQEHPRSIFVENGESDFPKKAGKRSLIDLLIENSSAVIITICVTSIALFVIVFVVLEGFSTVVCKKSSTDYRDYKQLSTQFDMKQERVLFSTDDGEDEDNLFEKT